MEMSLEKAEKISWRLGWKKFRNKRLTQLQQKQYEEANEIVRAASYALYNRPGTYKVHDTCFTSCWANIQVSKNGSTYTVLVDDQTVTFTKCDLRFYK